MTALMLAADCRFTGVALELLCNGAAVDLEDEEGRTALSFAVTGNYLDIAVALVDNGAKVDAVATSGRTPLLDATLYDHFEIAVELLRRNASVDITDENGRSALSLAAASGNVQAAAALIENGAVVDQKDKQGRMPLSYAAENGHAELVEELLQCFGAEVDAEDEQGMTALMHAAASRQVQITEALLQNGAAVNAKSRMGRATLSYAAESGHLELITNLIKRGAIIGEYDNDGKTALAHAAGNGRRDVVAALLQHGAFDSSSSSTDQVDLFLAVALGDHEFVTQFISNDESVDVTTKDGQTPLFYAAECGQLEMVQFLIENGASVQTTVQGADSSRECETPVTLAGRAGHMNVFQALVDAGASINIRSGADGETPLLSAVRRDFFAGVQLLIAHGGCLRVEDVAETENPLIPGSLGTMKRQLCGATFEFEPICTRVSERLGDICSQPQQFDSDEHREAQASNLVTFASSIFRFCRLLLDVGKRKSPLSRFIGSRAVINRVRDAHEELDHFVGMSSLVDNGVDWKAQMEEDQSSLQASFQGLLSTDQALMERVASDAQKRELTVLLQYELKTRGGERNSEVQEDIKNLLERFVRMCEIEVPVVPDWFISRDDVEFHCWNIVSEANGTKYDGKWKQTRVTIETTFAELEGATIPNTLQTIMMKTERLHHSQWMAKIAYPALEYVFALLREHQKLPTDIEVVKFCGVLSRFQRYLRTAMSEESVFALMRSRQVAESHGLIYSELDRLLDLLDISEADPIRAWRRDAAQGPGLSDETIATADSLPKNSESSNAVSLKHLDPLSPSHVLWTEAGLAAALPALPSWYLSLQDLVFSESDAIGQGTFGTVYKGSWLDTPVVIKFMGYDEDFGTISTNLLLHEVRVWHQLSHPHVLKLYGACHIDKRYFVSLLRTAI